MYVVFVLFITEKDKTEKRNRGDKKFGGINVQKKLDIYFSIYFLRFGR